MYKYCRTHYSGGVLPCAWPDCELGHKGQSLTEHWIPDGEPLKYSRESFLGSDGSPRYFWLPEHLPYSMQVGNLVRGELFRLARPAIGTIYHYTTLEALFGIVESEDLWMTDYSFLNDASEVEHGIELAASVFSETAASRAGSPIADHLRNLSSISPTVRPRICISCFSSARDSLSQWRAYSRSSVGVALGFGATTLLYGLGFPPECTLTTVAYSDAHKTALLSCFARFFAEAFDRDAARKLKSNDGTKSIDPTEHYWPIMKSLFFETVVCCKNGAFADEREVRLVYKEEPELLNELGLPKTVKRFRSADGLLVPYTTTTDIANTLRHSRDSEKQKFPLEEVIIGPHPKAELAIRSVEEYLAAKGFQDVRVVRSDLPFR